MQLATFTSTTGPRCGVLVDGVLHDSAALATRVGIENGGLLTRTRAVLEAGPDTWSALASAAAGAAPGDGIALADVVLGPPIPDPDKIICLGLNYRDHAAEANLPEPAAPMIFAKFRNSLAGPADSIRVPAVTSDVDFEAEMAIVIGRRAHNVSAADALDYVAGVMAFNDVSARDIQLATSQWGAGKAIDTFAPCGPTLVFLDEIADVQDLAVRTRVNGELLQDGNTRNMIFPVAHTIEFLTRLMTLEPGDIIATGTPAGVGMSRDPKISLTDGDIVEVEIGSVGVLRNRVVADRA